MRQEQFDLLQQRAEQLTDIFLNEADPTKWPGVGIEDANMDAKTRGDRYWTKKNAFATMSLVQRIVSVIDVVRKKTVNPDGTGDPAQVHEEEDDIEKEAAAAEREASKLINKMQKGTKAASAPKKTKPTAAHGKA